MTDDLVLELLRAIRSDTAALHRELQEIKTRLTTLEDNVAGILGFIATHDSRLAAHDLRVDRLAARIDRVERRLELLP